MKRQTLVAALVLVILLFSSAIPVANAIPNSKKDDFKNKVIQEIHNGRWKIPNDTMPQIQWIDESENWGVAFIYLAEIKTGMLLENAPTIVLGSQKGQDWNIYFPTERDYTFAITQMPAHLLPKSFFPSSGAANSLSIQTARNAGKLPWTYNQSRKVTQDRQNAGNSHSPRSSDEWAWDFGLSTDEAVVSSRSGIIAHIYTSTPKDTGCLTCDWTLANRVVVDHQDGTATLYMHLSNKTPPVSVLQRVAAGQIIGYADHTGRSGATHLHFALQPWNSSWDGAVTGTLWYQHSIESLFDDPNVPGGNPTWPNFYTSGNILSTTCSAPSLNSPADGATITSRTVTFDWGDSTCSGTTGYTLHVTTGSGPEDGVIKDTGVGPSQFDYTFPSDGTFYWHVATQYNGQRSAWSTARRIVVNTTQTPCSPNADQIALYANTGFGNPPCVILGIGEYPNPGTLGSIGNDNTRSIKVGGNVQAILFENDNYSGSSETFTGDDSNLTDNGIGSGTSSVKVQQRVQAPSTPTLQGPSNGLQFTENQGITLSWSATGSEYYGEITGGPAPLSFGWQAGASKNIGAQWPGYTYSWRVKARNGSAESGYNSTWTFTVKPATPTNLNAQLASCSQINLSWADNSGSEDGFRIYRNGSNIAQVGANATSYQSTGLSASTAYSYVVKAFKGSIESDSSNTAPATTGACAQPPSATFDAWPQSGIGPLTVAMHIVSTNNITNCTWDYGDGTSGSSCANSHDHVYANGGSYSVRLTVSGPGGTDSQTRASYITVYAPAQAAFDAWPQTGVAPLTVAMHNISSGDYDSCLWDYGDGTTGSSCADTHDHVYANPGNYTVQLTVAGAGGTNQQTLSDYITVSAPACPDAFEPDNDTTQLHDFSIGNTESHAFCQPNDQDWVSFNGVAGAIYRIETLNLAPDTDTVLELYGADDSTPITSDDDGNGGRASIITWQAATSDTYYVKVRDYFGAGDPGHVYDLRITATTAPNSPSNMAGGAASETSATFTWQDNSNDETGFNIYKWGFDGSSWDFRLLTVVGAGVTTFTDTGLSCGGEYFYDVSASNSIGESSRAGWIKVATAPCAPPVASFDAWPQSGSAPLTVAMHNISTGGVTDCAWEYGDGATGTSCADSHDHIYTSAGSYTVRLTVSGAGGSNSQTRTNYIVVSAPPQSTNLLANSGFELDTNTDNRPDSWTSSSKFTRNATFKHGGSYAGKHAATDNSSSTIYQQVNSLQGGKSYSLSGWLYVPAGTTDAFTYKIDIRWRNSSGSTIRTDVAYSMPSSPAKGAWFAAPAQLNLTSPAGTVAAQVRMVLGSLNAAVYADDLVFGVAGGASDTTPPTITGKSPASDATNVAVGANVSASFNETVVGVSGTTFTVTPQSGGSPVAASVTYDSATKTATLDPANSLTANTTYKVSLTNGIKDAANNALAATSWNFTTAASADTSPPTVTSRTPSSGATAVAVATNILTQFNEDVAGISTTTFTLTPQSGSTAVAANVSYDAANKIATLDPASNLAANTTYNVNLTSGIKDTTGNALVPLTWSFTTAAGSSGGTFAFTPDADTYVSQSSATSNYGTATSFSIVGGTSSAKQAFIRFTVSGLPAGAAIQSAKLRLFVTNDSTSGGTFSRVINNTWAESITWNTKPAIENTSLAIIGSVGANATVEVDLASAIIGNGTYSFAITLPNTNTNTLGYASKEASTTGNRPQLVIITQ